LFEPSLDLAFCTGSFDRSDVVGTLGSSNGSSYEIRGRIKRWKNKKKKKNKIKKNKRNK
jgi:hypothetical protein